MTRTALSRTTMIAVPSRPWRMVATLLAVVLAGCSSSDGADTTGLDGASSSASSASGSGASGGAGAAASSAGAGGGAGGTGGGGGAPPGPWLGSVVRFATAAEGNAILGTSDDFTQAMSAFDRGLRLGSTAATTEQDVLDLAGQQALDWGDDQVQAWSVGVEEVAAAIEGLTGLELPDEITLVQTTGAEEFDAAYTRAAAILLPEVYVVRGADSARWLLAHELFHVATRHDPALRDALAPLVGFATFAGVEHPASLEDGRLTNPDAFSLRHAIEVMHGGASIDVVPIYQSDLPLAVVLAGGDPWAAFQLRLLEVDVASATVVSDDAIPVDETDYAAVASLNTDYIVHAEEILADNFAWLVQRRLGGAADVPVPAVLDGIEAALSP